LNVKERRNKKVNGSLVIIYRKGLFCSEDLEINGRGNLKIGEGTRQAGDLSNFSKTRPSGQGPSQEGGVSWDFPGEDAERKGAAEITSTGRVN